MPRSSIGFIHRALAPLLGVALVTGCPDPDPVPVDDTGTGTGTGPSTLTGDESIGTSVDSTATVGMDTDTATGTDTETGTDTDTGPDLPGEVIECDNTIAAPPAGQVCGVTPGDGNLLLQGTVLAGYDTSVAGEAALMCFFLAQRVNDRAVPIFVPMAIASGQIDWRIARQAIRRGARADWVSLQPFESLLGEPLAWVRERLRIEAPQRAHPRPSKSDLLMLEEHAV